MFLTLLCFACRQLWASLESASKRAMSHATIANEAAECLKILPEESMQLAVGGDHKKLVELLSKDV